MASWGVIAAKAEAIAWIRAGWERAMMTTSPARSVGAQDSAHVGSEKLRIGGPFDSQARGRTVQAHRADHGGCMPMALRCTGVEALSP